MVAKVYGKVGEATASMHDLCRILDFGEHFSELLVSWIHRGRGELAEGGYVGGGESWQREGT